MADVKMPESKPCQFDQKGWAPCRRPSDNGLCSTHEGRKCSSCGAQALRSCDAQMGPLICGADLCNTCQHSFHNGNHVTEEVYRAEMDEQREFERTGKESKRVLAMRGITADIELPRHLKELIESGRKDFPLKVCYGLRIKQGSMREFPAIIKGTRIVVVTFDKEAIVRVWRSLAPRNSEIVTDPWMVNPAIGIGYIYTDKGSYQELSRPSRVFSSEEINDLFAKDDHPFEWAPGLLGGYVSQQRFNALIEEVAAV